MRQDSSQETSGVLDEVLGLISHKTV